ncbi:MAG: hypothetical protein A2Y77_07035 [Planctomycetes bacterium RBG_13_62_9]|nr:MAG: hypothetical protein A2Y77_07035 [Planctomycetes bacterium RBG_13_62_9]
MGVKHRWFWIAIATVLLVVSGCRPKEDKATQPQQTAGPGPAEIAAARDALTGGMQQISFDKLAQTHIGKRCVVMARSMQVDPSAPPLGMVRVMGGTTIYSGAVHEISPGSLKIRATHPGSGNLKIIEIQRGDIQSIHVAG